MLTPLPSIMGLQTEKASLLGKKNEPDIDVHKEDIMRV